MTLSDELAVITRYFTQNDLLEPIASIYCS